MTSNEITKQVKEFQGTLARVTTCALCKGNNLAINDILGGPLCYNCYTRLTELGVPIK